MHQILTASHPSQPGIGETDLCGEDIVCLALRPWHGPWKASQQLMSRIAQSNRVLYVGPPSSLRAGITGLCGRAARPPILEAAAPNLFVYHEPRLLTKSKVSRVFNSLTARMRLAHVRWLAARLGFQAPILWVFDPLASTVLGTFGEKLVIYHVVDKYVEYFLPHATRLRATVAQRENEMLKRADVVFAVSPPLYARCRGTNPNTFLVPNGVDFERFQHVLATAGEPADVRAIPRPIIGYVGVIQPTMNFSLLDRLASEHREWSILLVGPEELGRGRPRFEELLQHSNVYYLGPKRVDDIPRYMQSCDVCIMPDEERADGDVIKVYEYLACGRPIVSWDNGTARRLQPFVRIAADAAEFIDTIAMSLTEEPAAAGARIAAAREHSWQRRVAVLRDVVGGYQSSIGNRRGVASPRASGGPALG